MDDIRDVDLNLLKALVALLEERNVTRAAERLSRGQSAASGSLARLRELTGDELLVRSGRNMVATPKGEDLLRHVRPILDSIGTTLKGDEAFDPSLATQTFRLGLSDDLEVALLPPLLVAFDRAAPKARLIVRPIDYESYGGGLDKDEIDLVVSVIDAPIASWHQTIDLGRTGFATIYDSNHVASDPSKLADFLGLRHALVSFLGEQRGFVDDELDRLGKSRVVRAVVPRFSALPGLLKRMALVATVPTYVAARHAADHGLKVCRTPLRLPTYEIQAVWHQARASSAPDRWFRNLVSEYTSRLLDTS